MTETSSKYKLQNKRKKLEYNKIIYYNNIQNLGKVLKQCPMRLISHKKLVNPAIKLELKKAVNPAIKLELKKAENPAIKLELKKEDQSNQYVTRGNISENSNLFCEFQKKLANICTHMI